MKKQKLLKSILIPTLGISAIGTIAAVSTSCGKKDDPSSLQSIIITANEDSSFSLVNVGENNPNLQYSIDGKNWNEYSESGEIPILSGTQLYLRGNNPTGWSKGFSQYSTLSITGDASITGNVMGLLDNGATSEEDITDIPCDYCFSGLFLDSTGITSISDDFLPATNLVPYCYHKMFQGCTLLTTAPNLPAITLVYNCYRCMFQDCTSLTTTPKLPATTLVDGCYANMFQGCTSLTTAPDLPATKLQMNCYSNMFAQCTSLTTAPDLPATSLPQFCYYQMFNSCTSLNSIKIGYTGNYNSKYFSGWVEGVADSGTFYYNGSQTAQDFGFPEGWTAQPY